MAEHIAKSYSCDRCKSDLGSERPNSKAVVTAYFEGEWAPECRAEWKDLCPSCRSSALEFFQGLSNV
jgi:hypothetical protein